MKYDLFIDEKIKVWTRTYVSVEAESQEEAVQKCLNSDYKIVNSEILYNTEEPISDHPNYEIYNNTDYAPIYSK